MLHCGTLRARAAAATGGGAYPREDAAEDKAGAPRLYYAEVRERDVEPGVIFLIVVASCGLLGAAGGMVLSPRRNRFGGAVMGALIGLVLGGMVVFAAAPGTVPTARAHQTASR